MNSGAFSISLAGKDLPASRDFYTRLGFEVAGGNTEQNWLILRNGDHVIDPDGKPVLIDQHR